MLLHGSLLRYFDEVVRAGSIRAAAEKLNVASSAINRQVLRLEADLGVKLFERGARRLRLTAAGEILIHHVRRTLRDAERAKSEIEDLQGLKRGIVRTRCHRGGGSRPCHRCRRRIPETLSSHSFLCSVAAVLARARASLEWRSRLGHCV